MSDLIKCINKLKVNSSLLGADGIHNIFFKHLPIEDIRKILLMLMNTVISRIIPSD